jgi:hypothetical protein
MFIRVAIFAVLLTGCDPSSTATPTPDLQDPNADGGSDDALVVEEPDLLPALHFCKLDVDTVDDGCLLSP